MKPIDSGIVWLINTSFWDWGTLGVSCGTWPLKILSETRCQQLESSAISPPRSTWCQ